MELREIYTFIAAAEKLNFSKAGEQLGYTQSAVTLQIQKLEKELGIALFERVGKRIFLTSQGERTLVKMKKLVMDIDDFMDELQEGSTQNITLRVGFSESILSSRFPIIMQKFNEMYPNIQMVIKTGIQPVLAEMMMKNEIDLAYVIDRNIIDQTWNGNVIAADKSYFVVSAEHPLAKKEQVTIKDIINEKMILTERNMGYSYELSQLVVSEGLELNPVLETGNTDLIRRLLMRNQWVSYLPLYCIREQVEEGGLVLLSLPSYEVTVYHQVFWHKDKYLSKPMQDLIEIISQLFGDKE